MHIYPLQSESTDVIATALAAAHAEYPLYIGPNRDGAFLKSSYTDIPALRKALFPVLSKHGLSFRQSTVRESTGSLTLISTVSHSSGQFFSSIDVVTPESAMLRSYGTSLKYIRRQQMMALLQCDPFEDAEDNNAEHENKATLDNTVKESLHKDVDLSRHSYLSITPDQIDQLEIELDGWPDLAKSLFRAYEINRIADLRRSQFPEAMQKLLKIKSDIKTNKKQ